MPFDAPPPDACRGRLPEHGETVGTGITSHTASAPVTSAAFDPAQNVLKRDDRGVGLIPAFAEATLEQLMGQPLLRLGHGLQWQSIAWEGLVWNEVPVQVLVGLERIGGLLSLLRIERLDQARRRSGHRRRSRGSALRRQHGCAK